MVLDIKKRKLATCVPNRRHKYFRTEFKIRISISRPQNNQGLCMQEMSPVPPVAVNLQSRKQFIIEIGLISSNATNVGNKRYILYVKLMISGGKGLNPSL